MKSLMHALALTTALLMSGQAFAQKYPEKPVKVIVPFPAGGVTDIATRLITQKLSERLGQQFYVENVGGAGGNIGMGQAARAAGDGYTMLFASSSIVVNPSLYKEMPFDIGKDFIPVTKAGGSPNSWLVNPNFPAKTMKELIELFKKEPGKYSVGSPGTGTTPSLSIEMLKHDLGVNFVTVPFKGGGPMTQSLLGGFTPISCGAIGNSVPLIKDGKIRALAITTKKTLETLPDIPTLDSIGIKDEEAETMTGVFVPAGTPKPIVDLLQKEISVIVNMPDIKKTLLGYGIIPEGDSSADFTKYVQAEVAKWKKVIETAKVPKI
jgi:tripartite-type tricarboxylate transporter receptor subunit TctC